MKKVISFLLAASLCLVLVACSSGGSSPLDTIEGASKDQISAIQAVLEENNIKVKTCEKATLETTSDDTTNALAGALSEAFNPYDITDENGDTYRMTIRADDFTVFSIVDKDGQFVYGGLSGIFDENSSK